jgi:hypothetical protein
MVVEVDWEVEEAIKFVKVLVGIDCCNVGFLLDCKITREREGMFGWVCDCFRVILFLQQQKQKIKAGQEPSYGRM